MGEGRDARGWTLAMVAREASARGATAAQVLASLQALDVVEQAGLGRSPEPIVHERPGIQP